MVSLGRVLVTGAWLMVGVALLDAISVAPRKDTEEGLQSRLQRESDPVKKAEYEIRLGRLKLLEAIDAFDQNDANKAQDLLGAYLTHVRSSWQLLQSSGRNAFRHPEGFKELDIALRQDGRLIEDLSHRLSYYDRGNVVKTGEEIEQIRAAVMQELFPLERARAKAGKDVQH
jgi:hypothetical protein